MSTLISPLLQELQNGIDAGNREALLSFWQTVKNQGAPLIEPIPEDMEHLYVTFLWRANEEQRKICLLGDYFGFDSSHQLSRLAQTDVWYKTYRIKKDVWSLYLFSLVDPDDESYTDSPDPLNPISYTCPEDPENPESRMLIPVESVFALPHVNVKPWVPMGACGQAGGCIEEYRARSKVLNNERRVWVYTPKGCNPSKKYPLVVFTDGWEYLNMTQAGAVLDELISQGEIPLVVAAFVDIINLEHRMRELKCFRPFAEFLCEELLPWVNQNFAVTNNRAERTIVGASAGGLNAAFVAYSYPEVFGNVLAQSGAFQWKPKDTGPEHYLASLYEGATIRPVNFFLEVGQLEPESILEEAQHLARVLANKGHKVQFAVGASGHNFLAWNPGLKLALKELLN